MSTGSYPLMDIAREFDVPYGDVLTVSLGFRALYRREPMSDARWSVCSDALMRLDRLQNARYADLGERIRQHAVARWSHA